MGKKSQDLIAWEHQRAMTETCNSKRAFAVREDAEYHQRDIWKHRREKHRIYECDLENEKCPGRHWHLATSRTLKDRSLIRSGQPGWGVPGHHGSALNARGRSTNGAAETG